MSIEQDRKQAQDKSTNTKVLARLAKSEDLLTRQYVAANPNTPTEILFNLGVEGHDRIAINCITKDWHKYNSAGKYFNAYALVNAIPEFFFSQYNQDVYYGCTKKALMTIARSSKTKEEILEVLAEHQYKCIRACVAQNKNATINVLKILLQKESQVEKNLISSYIRSANKNKLRKKVKQLFYEAKYKSEVLPITEIKSTNNYQYLSKKILANIAHHETLKNSLFIARHPETSEDILEKLAREENTIIRHAVAGNPHINDKIIRLLAKDKELIVRQSIAINPQTDLNIIKKLANNKETLKLIKSNIKKSDKLLQYLIVYKSEVYNQELEYYIQKNPEKSSQYLSWVLEGYVRSSFVSVRTIALLNPVISADTLRKHSDSSVWLERYAVAKNISTSLDIIQKLTEDANKIVRTTAKDNLNNRQKNNRAIYESCRN